MRTTVQLFPSCNHTSEEVVAILLLFFEGMRVSHNWQWEVGIPLTHNCRAGLNVVARRGCFGEGHGGRTPTF